MLLLDEGRHTLRAALRYTAMFALALSSLSARNQVLWRDPGRVENLDFSVGPGGPHGDPKPPFTFIKEDLKGAYPKVIVHDARGRKWQVKFGREVHSEPFASRVAWAAGYLIEPNYFVPSGKILNVQQLGRAAKHITQGGEFENARFQLRDPKYKFSDEYNWSWTNNPFIGTPQLNGLKIVMMLVSNWDNKDARDQDEGINTAIFEHRGRYIYAFTDWGGSMGRWGGVSRRSVWNCEGFTEDGRQFARGIHDGKIDWGYTGRHNKSFIDDIRVSHVQWILRYVGRIRDAQFAAGLKASGATPDEVDCFTRELRRRINRLREVATSSSRSSHPAAAAR